MATAAQIAANRRNAAKSTGPKSVEGKKASSRNATKHGFTAAITDQEINRFADMLAAEFPKGDEADEDLGRSLRLLELAEAEARLERLRSAEREVLAIGDATLRLHEERDLIRDFFGEDEDVWKSMSERDKLRGYILELKISLAGERNARNHFRRLRYLREAEAQHAAALRAWIEAQ